MKKIITVIVFLISWKTFGQGIDTTNKYIIDRLSLVERQGYRVPIDFDMIRDNYNDSTLSLLKTYHTIQNKFVLAKICTIYTRIANTNIKSNLKQKLLDNIIDICLNSQMIDGFLQNSFYQSYALEFSKNDFESSQIRKIVSHIKSISNVEKRYSYLFLGWIDCYQEVPFLKDLLAKEKSNLYILLALGRLKDNDSACQAIEILRNVTHKNDNLGLLTDNYLDYLKNECVLNLYIDLLSSNEVIKGFQGGFGEEDMLDSDIACRALSNITFKIPELNTYLVSNFLDKKAYDDSMIWMKENNINNIEITKSYRCEKKTYEATKDWLLKNREKYIIKFDRDKFY